MATKNLKAASLNLPIY